MTKLQLIEELYKHNPQSVLYLSVRRGVDQCRAHRARKRNTDPSLNLLSRQLPSVDVAAAQALIKDERHAEAERIYKQISRQRPRHASGSNWRKHQVWLAMWLMCI